MDKYISELDTSRFGFPIARVNSFSAPVPEVLQGLREAGVRMVISRVSAEDVDLINEMEQSGFRLKDIQVVYDFDLRNPIPGPEERSQAVYRDFRPGDEEALQAIASRAFVNYGHYARNRELGAVDTGVIYADWARRCCTGRAGADKIVVAESSGRPVGYLALRVCGSGEDAYAAGVMGAVAEDFQSTGLFRGINIQALNWALDSGLSRVEHGVLISNHAVNKTYSGLGFRIIRSETTFHWTDIRPD